MPIHVHPAATGHPSVNDTFAALGLLHWKPVIGALLMPPTPWLLLLIVAWWLRRRRSGVWLLSLSIAGLWLGNCEAVGSWMERRLRAPAELTLAQVADLHRSLSGRNPVVLVLGGGAIALAPEYGEAHLAERSMQRLHYGLWLARQVLAPVMVSGGAGRGRGDAPAEAAVAARIAIRDYGKPLKWLEAGSADTRENARLSLRLLEPDGITDLLLVTHGWHMPRALRAFEQEAARAGFRARLIAAPMGMAPQQASTLLQWLPSSEGQRRVNTVLHELVGLLVGA